MVLIKMRRRQQDCHHQLMHFMSWYSQLGIFKKIIITCVYIHLIGEDYSIGKRIMLRPRLEKVRTKRRGRLENVRMIGVCQWRNLKLAKGGMYIVNNYGIQSKGAQGQHPPFTTLAFGAKSEAGSKLWKGSISTKKLEGTKSQKCFPPRFHASFSTHSPPPNSPLSYTFLSG